MFWFVRKTLMTSFTGCLNLHLLCMGSEKKKNYRKKPSSCEHELTILMSRGASHAAFTVPVADRISLPHVQKFISALECCSSPEAQLSSGDSVPVLPLKTWAALTGNHSTEDLPSKPAGFYNSEQGMPLSPSALPLSPPGQLMPSAPQFTCQVCSETGQDGNEGGTSGWGDGVTILPQHVPVPALRSHCLAGAALNLPACLYPCCKQEWF